MQFVILARKFIAMGEFLARKPFFAETISNKMFHSDYKHIIDRLPESLVKRACQRLLHHSKDPVPLESISEKSERIESYLRHTLEVYKNSLNRKRRTIAQEKILQPRSWLECNVFPVLPHLVITDSGVQTDKIAYIYEEENNQRVVNELKVLTQHLL